MNQYSEYLSAPEAAELLGVKRDTLYAYTSRGMIQSVAAERGPARRYRRADLERLRARRAARSGRPQPESDTLRFEAPLLDSSITWLTDSGPVYRGHSALELARRDTPFEAVAELLWTGDLPATTDWPAADSLPVAELHELVGTEATVLNAQTLTVAALAAHDRGRFDLRPDALLPRARALIRVLSAASALGSHPERVIESLRAASVADSIAIAIGARRSAAALRALNRALVLLADHELNASTFAARIAASTHADLYACLLAGLGALQGPRHGSASQRAAAFAAEVGLPERAEEVIYERLGRGELLPGFGHSVYSAADPRAEPLLETARSLAPQNTTVRTVSALVRAMARVNRPPVNVDMALVALGGALGVSAWALPAISGVSRAAGWTAHVLEQYGGNLLRPRARYTPPVQ